MGVIGLDYLTLLRFSKIFGVEFTPAVFRKIKALEAATLKAARPKEAT